MLEEEKFLLKRMIDLSRKAANKYEITFTDFLNLNECNLFFQNESEMYSPHLLFGGYKFSERQMIAFIPDALSFPAPSVADISFPISCLEIVPKNPKFAEKLSHRDVLGAMMNLGIERKLIGDILLSEQGMFLFCCTHISEFLIDSLHRIKHTEVRLKPYEGEIESFEPVRQECSGSVTALRMDCIAACMLGSSRSEIQKLIQSGLVFCNSKIVLKADALCKEKDVISVRGHGKFQFEKVTGNSKKGKFRILYWKYI